MDLQQTTAIGCLSTKKSPNWTPFVYVAVPLLKGLVLGFQEVIHGNFRLRSRQARKQGDLLAR